MIIETVHAWLITKISFCHFYCCIPDFDFQLEDNTPADGVIQNYSGSGIVWRAEPTVVPSNGGSSKPHVRLQQYCWSKISLRNNFQAWNYIWGIMPPTNPSCCVLLPICHYTLATILLQPSSCIKLYLVSLRVDNCVCVFGFVKKSILNNILHV